MDITYFIHWNIKCRLIYIVIGDDTIVFFEHDGKRKQYLFRSRLSSETYSIHLILPHIKVPTSPTQSITNKHIIN